MLTADYVGFLAVVVLAGFVQGASSFGFGLLAGALLPFFVDAKLAAVYLAVLAPILCARLLWGLREHASIRPVLPLVAGSLLIGLPLGTTLYVVSDAWLFKQVIGLALAGGCALLWGFSHWRTPQAPGWLATPIGAVSGTLTGAFNMGGPPIIVYMWTQPLDKRVINARLQTVFTVVTVARLVLLLAAPAVVGRKGLEHVTWSAVGTALTAAPFVMVAGWLGLKVFRRGNPAVLRRVAYALVIVGGLVLFARTRWGEDRSRPGDTQPVSTSAAAVGMLCPGRPQS